MAALAAANAADTIITADNDAAISVTASNAVTD